MFTVARNQRLNFAIIAIMALGHFAHFVKAAPTPAPAPVGYLSLPRAEGKTRWGQPPANNRIPVQIQTAPGVFTTVYMSVSPSEYQPIIAWQTEVALPPGRSNSTVLFLDTAQKPIAIKNVTDLEWSFSDTSGAALSGIGVCPVAESDGGIRFSIAGLQPGRVVVMKVRHKVTKHVATAKVKLLPEVFFTHDNATPRPEAPSLSSLTVPPNRPASFDCGSANFRNPFPSGDGTEQRPYFICVPEQLLSIFDNARPNSPLNSSLRTKVYLQQGADLDFKSVAVGGGYKSSRPFRWNGADYRVANLNLAQPIFSSIADASEITNLIIDNPKVKVPVNPNQPANQTPMTAAILATANIGNITVNNLTVVGGELSGQGDAVGLIRNAQGRFNNIRMIQTKIVRGASFFLWFNGTLSNSASSAQITEGGIAGLVGYVNSGSDIKASAFYGTVNCLGNCAGFTRELTGSTISYSTMGGKILAPPGSDPMSNSGSGVAGFVVNMNSTLNSIQPRSAIFASRTTPDSVVLGNRGIGGIVSRMGTRTLLQDVVAQGIVGGNNEVGGIASFNHADSLMLNSISLVKISGAFSPVLIKPTLPPVSLPVGMVTGLLWDEGCGGAGTVKFINNTYDRSFAQGKMGVGRNYPVSNNSWVTAIYGGTWNFNPAGVAPR